MFYFKQVQLLCDFLSEIFRNLYLLIAVDGSGMDINVW